MTVDDLTWYAIGTANRAEYMVARDLMRSRFSVFYPRYRDTVTHARRSIVVYRPLFPNYVFAGCDSVERIAPVYHLRGVRGVVGGREPWTIPAADMAELRRRASTRSGLIRRPPGKTGREDRFMPGATVRFTDGPFAGLTATVERDDGATVRVWLAMFRGVAPMIAFPTQLAESITIC